MFNDIKTLSGKEFKRLKKPIFFLVIDSLFYMMNYMMFYFTIVDLITNTFTLHKIIIYTVIMLIANILRYLFNRVGYTGIQSQGARIIQDLRLRMGDHLRNLNLGYFSKHNIGNVINIITNDLQDFEHVLTHSTSELIKLSILSVYLLLITFVISPILGFFQIAIAGFGAVFITLGMKKSSKIALNKKHTMDNVVSRMIEYISGAVQIL